MFVEKIKRDEEDFLIARQKSLQILIGVLGVLLPVLLYVFLFIDTQYNKPLPSISHYYFTRVSTLFIIVVSLLAFFLLIYQGKHDANDRSSINWDAVFSNLAALGALTLLLFPTSQLTGYPSDIVVTILKGGEMHSFRVLLHYIAAGIFLMALACLSFFVFTKKNPEPSDVTHEKKIRNVFFRVFGVLMATSLGIAYLGRNETDLPVFGESLTFWMETIAVECFGFSWLIKAEVFFKDKGL